MSDSVGEPMVAPGGLESRIERLEQMVAEASALPLSSSIMLHRDDITHAIAELKAAVPQEMENARFIIAERDQILRTADADATRIVDEARAERERLVSRTEVLQAANREADRIIEEARDNARQLRLEAEDYVDAKLANFEVTLQKILGAVERGRERLTGTLHAEAPEEG